MPKNQLFKNSNEFNPEEKIKKDADSGAKFGQIMEKGQFATLYLVEAGGEVVKDNKATVEGVIFPAFGTISLASMEAFTYHPSQVDKQVGGVHFCRISTSNP